MGMQQVSSTKIDVNFECEKCQRTGQLSIRDAVEKGAPECCDGKMSMVDCEVNSQMVFA